jgi:tRNA nucleotidyltransferase (CCA-adding enzyme)
MRQLAPLLGKVAAERVQVELGYLLKSPQGTVWLQTAWKDNLLQTWFPDATAQGVAQIAAVDNSARVLADTWHELGVELRSPVSGKSALISLAKLTCLLPSILGAAEEQLMRLKYSRAEIRAVVSVLKHLSQLLSYATSQMSLREQYFFFLDVGAVFPALAVLAVARGISVSAIAPLIDRYLNPDDQVAHPAPLLTGNDLMKALDLPASPLVGKLLTELQIARIEGKIASREDALEFAAQLVISN